MRKFLIATAVMAGLGAGTAHAAITVPDDPNDFIQNYRDHHPGTPDASLDITSFSVDLINGTFLLDATFAGSILAGPALGDFVLGVNTGSGTSPFGTIGAGNVLFDKVLVIGKTFLTTFNGHPLTATPITNNGVTNEFRLSFNVADFPPGATFDPSHFGFSLWTRDGTGGINSIADFAPDNSTINTAIPEPTGWALMITGFGLAGATLRGRRKSASARLA